MGKDRRLFSRTKGHQTQSSAHTGHVPLRTTAAFVESEALLTIKAHERTHTMYDTSLFNGQLLFKSKFTHDVVSSLLSFCVANVSFFYSLRILRGPRGNATGAASKTCPNSRAPYQFHISVRLNHGRQTTLHDIWREYRRSV